MGPWAWVLALLALGAGGPGGAGEGLDFPTYDGLDRVLPVTLKNYKATLKRFPVLALLHHPPAKGDRGAQRQREMEELVLEVGTGHPGDTAWRWGRGGDRGTPVGQAAALGYHHLCGAGDTVGDQGMLLGHWWGTPVGQAPAPM